MYLCGTHFFEVYDTIFTLLTLFGIVKAVLPVGCPCKNLLQQSSDVLSSDPDGPGVTPEKLAGLPGSVRFAVVIVADTVML